MLFNGSSVHLLRVIVFEEHFELFLIFIKLGEAIFKNVLSNFNLSVAELLKQVFVLLIVSVVALVLINLAHLILVLFVSSFTVLLLNEFVIDIFELF